MQFNDHFHLEHFLKHFSFNSHFSHLQQIIVNQLKFDQSVTFLISCDTLPRLKCLSMDMIEQIKCPNRIFDYIFRLSHLKTCRILFELPNDYDDTSLIIAQPSFIEHLTISGNYHYNDLIDLLCLTPNLKSLNCSISTYNINRLEIAIPPPNLISINFTLKNISFDEFQWFLSSFAHQIEICRLSIKDTMEFLDCHRWEQLICESMPKLHQFSLHHQMRTQENLFDYNQYHYLISQFDSSSFFSERKIFFIHQHHRSQNNMITSTFYSIEPYRYQFYSLIFRYKYLFSFVYSQRQSI